MLIFLMMRKKKNNHAGTSISKRVDQAELQTQTEVLLKESLIKHAHMPKRNRLAKSDFQWTGSNPTGNPAKSI